MEYPFRASTSTQENRTLHIIIDRVVVVPLLVDSNVKPSFTLILKHVALFSIYHKPVYRVKGNHDQRCRVDLPVISSFIR